MILRRQNALFDAMAGFLGGVTGGAAAFPGAFVTIWCGFKGWPKEKQRASYQPFILIVQLAAIAILALPGFIPQGRPAFDFAGFFYLPAMLLGSTIGMACFNRLSDRQFSLAVNLLLVVSGVSFLLTIPVVTENLIRAGIARGWARVGPMLDFLRLFIHVLAAPFRTQAQLEAEITLLRHQLNVLRRQASRGQG